MKHIAIEQVVERAERAKSDSDFTYFFSLLLASGGSCEDHRSRSRRGNRRRQRTQSLPIRTPTRAIGRSGRLG